jgi:hypothetical protein
MRFRATLAAAMLVGAVAVSGAAADPPHPVEFKDHKRTGAHNSENCVAVQSSQAKHNGTGVREQAHAGNRSEIVHAAQDHPGGCP